MQIPSTFVALGLVAGLSVDTYHSWKREEAGAVCKPPFAVDLNKSVPLFYSATPAHAKQQAMIAWMQGVVKVHGPSYANFWQAKASFTDVSQCQSGSDGVVYYCGFASGEPCRR